MRGKLHITILLLETVKAHLILGFLVPSNKLPLDSIMCFSMDE